LASIYAESSVVLTWLLGEPRADEFHSITIRADSVVSSVLTIVEVRRGLLRREKEGGLSLEARSRLDRLLTRACSQWHLMEITPEVRARAEQVFPVEPVRTLDALHLATALHFARAFPGLQIASFDGRVRGNARALGLGPAEPAR